MHLQSPQPTLLASNKGQGISTHLTPCWKHSEQRLVQRETTTPIQLNTELQGNPPHTDGEPTGVPANPHFQPPHTPFVARYIDFGPSFCSLLLPSLAVYASVELKCAAWALAWTFLWGTPCEHIDAHCGHTSSHSACSVSPLVEVQVERMGSVECVRGFFPLGFEDVSLLCHTVSKPHPKALQPNSNSITNALCSATHMFCSSYC